MDQGGSILLKHSACRTLLGRVRSACKGLPTCLYSISFVFSVLYTEACVYVMALALSSAFEVIALFLIYLALPFVHIRET